MDFSKFRIGDKEPIPGSTWDDSMREILAAAAEFANKQEPRWQFQADRVEIGNKSTNPPTKDKYVIERIR